MQGFINRRIPLFLRRAVTMAPALVVLALGLDPSSTLVISQVVLSFGIPFALVPMILLTRRPDVMGALVNQKQTTIIASHRGGDDHRPQRLPPVRYVLRVSRPVTVLAAGGTIAMASASGGRRARPSSTPTRCSPGSPALDDVAGRARSRRARARTWTRAGALAIARAAADEADARARRGRHARHGHAGGGRVPVRPRSTAATRPWCSPARCAPPRRPAPTARRTCSTRSRSRAPPRPRGWARSSLSRARCTPPARSRKADSTGA